MQNRSALNLRLGTLVFLLCILSGFWLESDLTVSTSPGVLCMLLGCLLFPTIPIFGVVMMLRNDTDSDTPAGFCPGA